MRTIVVERDRGDHSIGAIWRRCRLTCASREQLGSYLLGVLDPGHQAYLDFHLQAVACPFCQANLTDLQALQQKDAPQAQQRRRRFFQSSALFWMPESVINKATQNVEAKSPRTCGSSDIVTRVFDRYRPFETPRRRAWGWAVK